MSTEGVHHHMWESSDSMSSKASKKKLADMDIEEFMSGDFDSDSEDEESVSEEESAEEEEEEEQMNVQVASKNGKGDVDDGDEEEDSDDEDEEENEDHDVGGALDDDDDDDDESYDDEEDIEDDSGEDDTSGEDEDEDEDSSSDDEAAPSESKIHQTAIKSKGQEVMKSRTKTEGVDKDTLNLKSSEITASAKKKTKDSPKKESKKSDTSESNKSDMAAAVTEDSKEASKTGKKPSAVDKHKKSIESLKEKDPDFYQFLQENDQELLNFEDSDANDESDADEDDDFDDEEDDSDSDEDGTVHKLPDKLEVAQEVSDEEGDSSEEEEEDGKKSKKGTVVTIAMVDKWGDQLENNNVQAFKELVEAFAAAIHGMPDDQEEEQEMKYKVQGSNVFNAIVSLCLKGVHPMLQSVLKMDSNTAKRLALPSSSKAWKNVHNVVREYLQQVIQLLAHMVDPAIACVVVRHIHKMIPFYCCFPKMTRSLIKKLVPLWSTGEETVRVVAFLCLFSITRHMKKPDWLELILKQMYMAYVKNTKFTSPSTLPLITFMQRSLTEMFALNSQVTYQHAFVYIRQLAIHLRNAITIKKDQFQSVYNWQYIHCVWLWCRVLGTLHLDQTLQPLVYPLVQTAIGVIKLIPAAKYIPLRFSVVRALNILSDATETFIPLIPHILDVFDIVDFNKRPVGVSFRPLNFAVMLKLSSKQLAEKGFKDGLMDEMYELILEHLVIHSYSISFPELALPVILRLKAFIKGSRIPSYSKLMKGLLDKIQENCREVTQKRDAVTFGLADDQAVRSWESKLKEQGTALSKHYATYKPLRERELKTEEAGKDRMLDLNFPTIEKRERQRKMKEEDKEDFKELFEKDSDSEDDILVRAERKEQRKKEDRKKGRKRRKQQDSDDDSDFDDDDDDGLVDFDDDNFDDDESSDDDDDDDVGSDEDGDSGEELGSDGDLNVHKGKPSKDVKATKNRGKKVPQKNVQMDDDDKMDDVQDVVEDFELWSEDEEGEGGKKEKSKKKKFDKGKGKKHGKGKKWNKKAKMEGKA